MTLAGPPEHGAAALLALALLILLVVANGAPVLARRLLRQTLARPIDGGRHWRDGRPLLGASKTWRGLVSGTLAAGLASLFMGLGFGFGLLFGLLALLGDLASSFSKRRLGLAASARATGLDQLPEAILPLLLAMAWWGLAWYWALAVALAFMVVDMLVSPLLHRLGIRRQPH
ncbi:MAG: CDP-archaeol synthase [Marinobacter sp.]|uniref:CDP-archaeol synthase n=1 Tax=Marinobacter sp. TaxID=50741 RepID=UPI00299D18F7|nr:CDP-archaeol synthase [Marinobacter sp.]MDX1633278.1 CDP-archaeol synthase [Marinobacter sp.]